MKKFLTLFTLFMAIVMVVPHADAKRFGGGKSFGKSFKTAPAQRQQVQRTDAIKKQPQAGQKGFSKKGMMGGFLGGMLAGGLLAAIFSGAGFEGIQFMDILIIGLLLFAGFKIFKMLKGQKAMPSARKTAYASNQGHAGFEQSVGRTSSSNAHTGFNNDVPYNLPSGFDAQAFISRACNHYKVIQHAWDINDMKKIQEYVSPAFFSELVAERNAYSGEQQTQVLYVNAQIVRADYNRQLAEVSLKFSGKLKETPEMPEQDITDIWHLQRDLTKQNSPWLIVGIQN